MECSWKGASSLVFIGRIYEAILFCSVPKSCCIEFWANGNWKCKRHGTVSLPCGNCMVGKWYWLLSHPSDHTGVSCNTERVTRSFRLCMEPMRADETIMTQYPSVIVENWTRTLSVPFSPKRPVAVSHNFHSGSVECVSHKKGFMSVIFTHALDVA